MLDEDKCAYDSDVRYRKPTESLSYTLQYTSKPFKRLSPYKINQISLNMLQVIVHNSLPHGLQSQDGKNSLEATGTECAVSKSISKSKHILEKQREKCLSINMCLHEDKLKDIHLERHTAKRTKAMIVMFFYNYPSDHAMHRLN